jgi:CelD/BcsL family acetyltransferase involved in cellulose biosynthesis
VPLTELDVGTHRSEWGALAEAAGNLFATPEWAECWQRHVGHRYRPLTLGARADDCRLMGVVPLAVRGRRPLRVARFQGSGVGDELGPACAPEDRDGVAAALREALDARELPLDLLLAERMPAPQGWARALGMRRLRDESSPVLRTDATSWDDYLASKSSNFRSQLRRKERALARDHGLAFRLADDPERLHRDLDVLFDLHRARWGGAESVAFAGPRVDFHREFAAVALERGWLRLWILELDGRPAAAWQGFRFAGAELFYQSGRDPACDRLSVGLVLLAHTIRAALEDGVREYKLLRGGEGYKDRFATDDPGLETAAVARGTAARAAVAAARGFFAIPEERRARARTRLRRLRPDRPR